MLRVKLPPNAGNDVMDVNTPRGEGEAGALSIQGCVSSARRPGEDGAVPASTPGWDADDRDGSVGGPAHPIYDHVYDIDRAPSLPLADLTQLLGGKAANLVVMATELGLPVPPAFAFATAVCKTFLTAGWPM